MTNWQEYGAALHLALCCEIKALREPTKEGAAAAAQEGSRECLLAYELATSDEGRRLAEEHGGRLTELLDYLASADGQWPKPRDPDARSRFGAALDAGIEHSHDALREDGRKAASKVYGKAARRLAEAAVAAENPEGEHLAKLTHKCAAQQVERVTDSQAWALPGEIAALHQKLAKEDREGRGKTVERGLSR